jgi:hypothetical protein
MECEFCKNIFSTKANLNSHQKTAKYCLNNRKKDIEKKYKCFSCNKEFNRQQHLSNHILVCKVNNIIIDVDQKYNILKEEKEMIEKDRNNLIIQLNEKNIQILKYENQIQDLQNKLENLAKQGINKSTTTTNNTTTNNILNLAPLDMNALKEQLSNVINTKMTEEHVLEGQEGIAKLVSCCFTTDDGKKLITCSDISRGVWKSKDLNGNIIKDYKANNIAKVIKPIATLKANEIIEIDDIKRKKIYEVICIKKRRKERIDKEKFEMATQRGYKKNSIEYNMCEDRMQKRFIEQKEDDKIEKEIIEEFRKSNDLYLLDLPEDIDKPYKMYLGKKDIVEMADDSSKFSSKLVNLV